MKKENLYNFFDKVEKYLKIFIAILFIIAFIAIAYFITTYNKDKNTTNTTNTSSTN